MNAVAIDHTNQAGYRGVSMTKDKYQVKVRKWDPELKGYRDQSLVPVTTDATKARAHTGLPTPPAPPVAPPFYRRGSPPPLPHHRPRSFGGAAVMRLADRLL